MDPRGNFPGPKGPCVPGEKGCVLGRRQLLQGSLFGLALFSLHLAGCSSSAEDSSSPSEFDSAGRPIAPSQPDSRIPVLWLETGTCTGCAESLMDHTSPSAEEWLSGVRLEFQETLMEPSGISALLQLNSILADYRGKFVLIVDGAIPTGEHAALTVLAQQGGQVLPAGLLEGQASDGSITAEALVSFLASSAAHVVALGTCASYGGIPASTANNPFGYCSVAQLLAGTKQVVRIPGCPPHPDWIVGTLSALLAGQAPALDAEGRPTEFYATTVHQHCPRRASFDAEQYASSPGDPSLCLYQIGCKGIFARGDCPSRTWNGQSSCLAVNHPCLGCTAPGFPDPKSKDSPAS